MQFVLFVLLKNETDFNTLKIFNKKYIVCLYKKGVNMLFVRNILGHV